MKKWIVAVVTVLAVALGFTSAQPTRAQGYTCTQSYVVQYGDNLFRIARRFGTTVWALQQLNGIANPNHIYAGQWLCVAQGYTGSTYVVQYGDTLARIARRFGVNLYTLAQANNIWNINRIYAGQVLVIPYY
jgi:LysM repeat protein